MAVKATATSFLPFDRIDFVDRAVLGYKATHQTQLNRNGPRRPRFDLPLNILGKLENRPIQVNKTFSSKFFSIWLATLGEICRHFLLKLTILMPQAQLLAAFPNRRHSMPSESILMWGLHFTPHLLTAYIRSRCRQTAVARSFCSLYNSLNRRAFVWAVCRFFLPQRNTAAFSAGLSCVQFRQHHCLVQSQTMEMTARQNCSVHCLSLYSEMQLFSLFLLGDNSDLQPAGNSSCRRYEAWKHNFLHNWFSMIGGVRYRIFRVCCNRSYRKILGNWSSFFRNKYPKYFNTIEKHRKFSWVNIFSM